MRTDSLVLVIKTNVGWINLLVISWFSKVWKYLLDTRIKTRLKIRKFTCSLLFMSY